MIKLKINGREIAAEPGATVLEAAQAHGLSIPNLCAAKGLSPYGGCRLCLVEISGRRGYVPACCTPVEENLEVITETPQLRDLRRLTLELILSEHPHACLICAEKKDCEDYKSTTRKVGEVTGCVLCPENGHCRIQEVVAELKVDKVRYPASYRNFEVHREDPFIDRNYNLCILCARCVRVCSEVRGASAVSVVFRGPQAVIGTALDRPLIESGCQLCGACLDVCPTGALTERALKGEGEPDETRRTICPLCSVGCSLEVGLRKGRIISSQPADGDEVNNGQACVKGRFLIRDVVQSPRRVFRPMVRRDGELAEASWDEALELVAQKLAAGAGRDAAFVVSSQLSLEDQYIAGKFARTVWDAEAVLDSPAPSVPSAYRGFLREQGISARLNFEMASLASAGLILAAGTDIALSHPILWLNIIKAVRKGAKLIVWNPAESPIDRWATSSLRTKPGSEAAVLGSLCRLLLERAPKSRWRSLPGHEELERFLGQAAPLTGGSPAGPKAAEIRLIGQLLEEARPGIFLCGPGLLGRPDSARLIRLIWSLARLAGATVIPLAEENNERGLLELRPPDGPNGLSLGQIVRECEQGRLRRLYLAGAFPPLADARPEFVVVQDSYQTANSRLADVVFPAATWAETEGAFVNVEGRIRKFTRLVDPLGDSKPDWWIFCRLAERMGSKEFTYQSSAEIAEEIGKRFPALREVSSPPLKKGRPPFVQEDTQSVDEPVPAASAGGTEGSPSDSASPGDWPAGRDRYRGLDLCQESKGFRRLREQTKVRGPKKGA